MFAVWERGNTRVTELIESGNFNVAYTTVMTTLDRLYRKHFLNRELDGRAFRYTARFTEDELDRAMAVHTVRQLLASCSSTTLPLSYLVEAVTEHDHQLLDELQLLIEHKRRQLNQHDQGFASE